MQGHTHHLPGRLRLRFQQLRRNPSDAARVSEHLSRIDGVLAVDAQPITGGLLIYYDVDKARGPALWNAMRATLGQHGLESAAPQARAGGAGSSGSAGTGVAKVVAAVLVEKIVERSALALVAALL
jgi:hypothetical protein